MEVSAHSWGFFNGGIKREQFQSHTNKTHRYAQFTVLLVLRQSQRWKALSLPVDKRKTCTRHSALSGPVSHTVWVSKFNSASPVGPVLHSELMGFSL